LKYNSISGSAVSPLVFSGIGIGCRRPWNHLAKERVLIHDQINPRVAEAFDDMNAQKPSDRSDARLITVLVGQKVLSGQIMTMFISHNTTQTTIIIDHTARKKKIKPKIYTGIIYIQPNQLWPRPSDDPQRAFLRAQ
jgi:hypothetical protein